MRSGLDDNESQSHMATGPMKKSGAYSLSHAAGVRRFHHGASDNRGQRPVGPAHDAPLEPQ